MIVPLRPDETFEEAVASSSSLLMAEALRLTRTRDAAEDLVQDTICRALETQSRPEILRAWLLAILRNLHRDQGRRSRPVTALEVLPPHELAQDEQGNQLRWHGPSSPRHRPGA